MKKTETIKTKKEFSNIINNSNFFKTKDFVIYCKESNFNKTRFGIAISTKIGNAVVRNKLKRQTREIIDKLKIFFKNNTDYIIMIRKANLDDSFKEKLDCLEKKLKEIQNEKK